MSSSLKLHLVKGTNRGTVSADFRGPNEIGHAQGDEHRTIGEHQDPSDLELTAALAEFPTMNTQMQKYDLVIPAEFGGGEFFFRFGVWDS